MDPNARLLKSDPPDIPRLGTRVSDEWGRRAAREAHRLSYNLCSHLKETLPGGTRSRIARTPRVWSYITFPGGISNRSLPIRLESRSGHLPVGRRLALKKCCHLKVEFPPRFRRRRKGYPADSNAVAFSE